MYVLSASYDRSEPKLSCCRTLCVQVVFILWGAQAQKKGAGINTKNHLVLKSPHPSGLSANKSTAEFPHGFFQNHHFARCNTYLKEHGLAEIDW